MNYKICYSSIFLTLLSSFLFIGSCASIPVNVSPNGRHIPADFAGIVHAGMTDDGGEYDLINSMGISWMLQTFYWHIIEPEQGQWDYELYDTFLDNAIANNKKVLGVLAYDVYWIHDDKNARDYISGDQIPFFLEYVRRTAEHFKGRVSAWSIWNEPNFSRFWTGTIEEFVELSRQTADVIKEVDSDVIILAGAFNRGVSGMPKKFIKRLFESGAMEKVDFIAFHPYEMGVSRSIQLYERFRVIVDRYGFSDRIWVTEMGFPTGGWYPTKVSEKKFPAAVVKIFAHLAAAGAQKLLWYQLFDPEERSLMNSENYFGLVRSREDRTSKAAQAYRLCALYMPGAVCYVLNEGLPGSIKAFWFNGPDTSALILWKDGSGSSALNLKLPGTDHLQHNIVTGNQSSISNEIIIKAGSDPVFITYTNDFSGGELRPVFLSK